VDFRRSRSSYKSKLPTDREAKLFSWAAVGKSGVGGGGDDRYSNLYYDLIPGVMDPSNQGVSSQVATEARDDSVIVSPLFFKPDTTVSSVREEANEKKKGSNGSSSDDEKEDLWAQWGVVRQSNAPLADALGGKREITSKRDGTSGLSTSVQTMKTNQARPRSDKYKPQSSPHDDDAVIATLHEDSAHRLHPLIDLGSLSSPPKSVKLPPYPSKPPTAYNTSHHPNTEYSMNIGGVERSSGVPQPRSLIETERTRQSRVAASQKEDRSSRIVRY
jgi:hypothetical protein